MKRYCMALDLKEDEALIAEYEYWHKKENGWPEVRKSIIDSNVLGLEIYRAGNRLFMIMDTKDDFDFEHKKIMDEANDKVQEWETFMWKFQQPIPSAKPGEKWVIMDKIFQL